MELLHLKRRFMKHGFAVWSNPSDYEAPLDSGMKRSLFRLHVFLPKIWAKKMGWLILLRQGYGEQVGFSQTRATRRRRAGAKRRQPPKSSGGARGSPMQRIDWTAERNAWWRFFCWKFHFQSKKIGDTPTRTSGIKAKKWGASFLFSTLISQLRVQIVFMQMQLTAKLRILWHLPWKTGAVNYIYARYWNNCRIMTCCWFSIFLQSSLTTEQKCVILW